MRIAFMATARPALAGAAHADADPFERRFGSTQGHRDIHQGGSAGLRRTACA
jgi:hypothetical protein